ncbi:MAG TPA: MFS transporter [Actinomycetota bacterium]|nr:MFS transporter [Actinomycetota bacterium]
MEIPAKTTPVADRPRLGIRRNLSQFMLLVAVNGLVGALVGQERTLVPLFGERIFALRSTTAVLLFIVTFGVAKALSNLAAGALADRIGRKRILIAGWAIGLPVPVLLMIAPSWNWVVAGNILLGINQGLTWSITVMMKIDLAGPRHRGLAMGLNEFSGYLAVGLSAAASGALAARYGLRPEPLFLGLAIAALGLGVSGLFVKDTSAHAELEHDGSPPRSFGAVVRLTSFGDPRLAAISRTGLVNNANDAHAWGLLPLLLIGQGLSTAQIGVVAALYPAAWGLGQLLTGPLSDRIGRRIPIAGGMWIQAGALFGFALMEGLAAGATFAIVLGIGTALTYPALLAAVGDVAGAGWRAAAIGVYRTWRDSGYVIGALAAGAMADLFDLRIALVAVAAVTALSGFDAWVHLRGDSSSDSLNSVR